MGPPNSTGGSGEGETQSNADTSPEPVRLVAANVYACVCAHIVHPLVALTADRPGVCHYMVPAAAGAHKEAGGRQHRVEHRISSRARRRRGKTTKAQPKARVNGATAWQRTPPIRSPPSHVPIHLIQCHSECGIEAVRSVSHFVKNGTQLARMPRRGHGTEPIIV